MITIVVILALAIAALVFIVMSSWRVFSKGEEAGWKCLIPVLGPYTLTCIATDDKRIRVASLVANIANLVATVFAPMTSLMNLGFYGSSSRFNVFSAGILADFLFGFIIIASAAAFIVNALSMYLLVLSFDESRGLGAVGIIAPHVVMLILGFDPDVAYGGPVNIFSYGGNDDSGSGINFAS